MSELQKKIARILRREGPAIGFGARVRETPKAMLLAALVRDEASARAALDAGADAVVFRPDGATPPLPAIEALKKDKITTGAWLAALTQETALALANAGCDFVVSTIDATESTAVDSDRMGHLLVASSELDDTTLRSLGPLGLEGLVVELPGGAMTLKEQIALVRIGSFSNTQLVVVVDSSAAAADLRVLRDSGAAAVIARAGSTPEQIKALVESLKAVPPPRKGKEGREIALVPSVAAAQAEEQDDEDDDPDE
jgi:hypothetical protein